MKALDQAPSLRTRYEDGHFVRLTCADYRTYSAAIRCYGQDVAMRPMRGWREFQEKDLPNLTQWTGYCVLGA
ncbi:MAG: hypothetical protein WBV85_11230 [Solirubrobacteraceae bacterium]